MAECKECGKDCDDCERIEPFTVETSLTARIDEDGEVSLEYEDDIDIQNIAETILTRLSEKYKEDKISIDLSWDAKDCRRIIFNFEQKLRIEALWENCYTNVCVTDTTNWRRHKHLGYVGQYQLGDFIVDHLDRVYLTPDERLVKDVIE